MPGLNRRRTRHTSDDLFPTQAEDSGPASKKARSKKDNNRSSRAEAVDPDGENLLEDDNLLVTTIRRAGLLVKTGKEPNVLTSDQAVFVKKINKDISTHLEYPGNIQVGDGVIIIIVRTGLEQMMNYNC